MVYFGRLVFLSKQSLWVDCKYIGLAIYLFSGPRGDIIGGVGKFLLVLAFGSKYKLFLERIKLFS